MREKHFKKELERILEPYQKKEDVAAKKQGFMKTVDPDGWLPINPDKAFNYLDTLNGKYNSKCPNCKEYLMLRYKFMIHENSVQPEFVPIFICSECKSHYKIKNGWVVPLN